MSCSTGPGLVVGSTGTAASSSLKFVIAVAVSFLFSAAVPIAL